MGKSIQSVKALAIKRHSSFTLRKMTNVGPKFSRWLSHFSLSLHCYASTVRRRLSPRSVGGGWSCWNKRRKKKRRSENPVIHRHEPDQRAGSEASEVPLKLYPPPPSSVCPSSPSFYHLSQLSLFASHSLSYPPSTPLSFFPYSALSLGWIFLFMRALRRRRYLPLSACRGGSLSSHGSIRRIWQTSGIACHVVQRLLVWSSDAGAV